VEKVLALGRVVGLANHTVLIARDGTERQIADSGAPISDAEGSVIGVVLVFRDVTEEYRMHEALRQSDALYRSLVAHIPQCILRKDLEGRFTFADESFCRLLGKSPEEVLGKTDFDFYPSDLAEKYRNDDRRVVETLVEFQTDEKNILPNGEILYVHVIKVPIKDASGKAVGIQCIFEDITERKRAEEELRKRMEELVAWHDVTIGREGRVMELKNEVNDLLAKLGQPPRYESPGA
jgi:PAS domain S-box-containing protein